jgi:hypothetical protein
MGSGKMGYWSIGKILLDRAAIKCLTSLFKPTFQYSTIPSPHMAYMEYVRYKNNVISIIIRIFET